MFSRRSFLFMNATLYAQNAQSIEDIVQSYPTKITGAKSVHKYPVLKAKHALVHIRQEHESPYPELSKQLDTAESIARLIAVQSDIYSIIMSLKKSGFCTRIHQEGFSVKQYDDLIKVQHKLYEFAALLVKQDIPARLTAARPKNPQYNTVRRLEYEKNIVLLPAEYDSTYHENCRVQNLILKEIDEEVEHYFQTKKESPETSIPAIVEKYRSQHEQAMNAREDALLEIVHDRAIRMAHTVYGGLHDWHDNVQKWNAKHSNAKFALIVITPASYEDSK